MTVWNPGADPYLSPPLQAAHLALLRRCGQERPTTAGQVLFREGDRAYEFIVVLSGAVTMVNHEAGWCGNWPPSARVGSCPSSTS